MTHRAAIVTVSLTAALLAVCAAASASGTSAVAANFAVQSDVLSVVITAFLFLALGMLLALGSALLRRRSRGGEEPAPERRPGRLHALGVLLALGMIALMIFLLWHGAHGHRTPITGVAPLRPTSESLPQRSVFNDSASAATAGVIVVAIAFVLGRRRFAWLLRRRLFAGKGFTLSPAASLQTGPALMAAVPGSGSMVESIGDPNDELEPRRSIMLAYQRFVSLMASIGSPRAKSETPFEFSRRILNSEITVPPDGREATSHLAALFTTARYSDETVTADDRLRAIGDLDLISRYVEAPS